MHPSLKLNDIQRLIFKSLKPHNRVAQIYKAFFHTATDELLETMHSFSPFLSYLPPDLELQRYDLYVPKIQNLFLESKAVMVLPPPFQSKSKSKASKTTWGELWEEILKLRPILELLSNLRRLRISNVEERLLVPLIGLSGSNLTQIHIQLIETRRIPRVTLEILDGVHYTPKLESLFVRNNEARLVDLI